MGRPRTGSIPDANCWRAVATRVVGQGADDMLALAGDHPLDRPGGHQQIVAMIPDPAAATPSSLLHRRTLLAGLAAVPVAAKAQPAPPPPHRLTLLHLNDFHSRHEPVDGRALTCAPGRDGCFGGAARLATALAQARAAAEGEGRQVLLLDGGDQFQGSMFYTVHRGAAELAVMHALGTEAMAVGNHEFDNGPETLGRFVRGARFPVLSCNVDAAAEPLLAGLLRPYALFDRAGLRIGVVGLTTLEALVSSSPGDRVAINEPRDALTAAAAACRAQGAQLVVALSHLGINEDRRLAGVVPGVSVFLGGHSHTLLSNAERDAAGPYPIVQDGPAGQALIVQAGCFGRYIGRLDLDLAADGSILAWGGECRHVGLDLPEDPAVAAIVAGFAAPLQAARRKPVGYTAAALPADLCRVGECALGNLVADAVLHAVHGADAAVLNAGGIRTGMPAGDLTLGDVMQSLPFGNVLATVQLHGRDLLGAVSHGLDHPGNGAFPLLAGLQAVWNPAAPAGSRLVGLQLRRPDGSLEPVDPDRVYSIVTNNYLRSGGDGYIMMRDRAVSSYDGGPGMDVVVADALAKQSTPPATDGRLTPSSSGKGPG